jgi:hypothetical protein
MPSLGCGVLGSLLLQQVAVGGRIKALGPIENCQKYLTAMRNTNWADLDLRRSCMKSLDDSEPASLQVGTMNGKFGLRSLPAVTGVQVLTSSGKQASRMEKSSASSCDPWSVRT